MAGGAGNIGGLGGMGQQPPGNASARPYNPTGGAPTQTSTPTNAGAAMGSLFGTLGQPAGNAYAQNPNGPNQPSPLQAPQQTQPFGMQPMQSPFQAPQQPQQDIGIGDFMQKQMGAQMGMQPGMQPSQSDIQQKLNEAFNRRDQMPQGPQMPQDPQMPFGLQPGNGGQLGFPPPTQTGQPMPPSFGRQLGADEQAPNPYMQDRLRSLLPPMQTPFQMPEGGGQLGPNPYQMPSPYPGPGKAMRPDLLGPMGQPPQGGIAGLPAMQPQSKQQMKEQMRQQQRMGPAPRVRPGGQPQQMYAEPQQYMY